MKKVTNLVAAAAVAVALLFGTNAKAQTTDKSAWRLGVGVEGGIPTGNGSAFSNFELGGSARLQYGIAKNTALTLTSGYTDFLGKTVDGFKEPNRGIVPVKVGVKAFFTDNLYFGAEGGAGFETTVNSNTKLLLSPALGWANKSWDIGVNYTNYSGKGDNYGSVGLRLAYGFSL